MGDTYDDYPDNPWGNYSYYLSKKIDEPPKFVREKIPYKVRGGEMTAYAGQFYTIADVYTETFEDFIEEMPRNGTIEDRYFVVVHLADFKLQAVKKLVELEKRVKQLEFPTPIGGL